MDNLLRIYGTAVIKTNNAIVLLSLLFTVANLEEAHHALLGVDHGHEDRVFE